MRTGTLAVLGARIRSWEGFLALVLLCIIVMNALTSPSFLSMENQVNLFASRSRRSSWPSS